MRVRRRWRLLNEIFFTGYLAYVGVITKIVGRESLPATFFGSLVASDFFICSWRRCSSPRRREMVRSLGISCSVQSQCWPEALKVEHKRQLKFTKYILESVKCLFFFVKESMTWCFFSSVFKKTNKKINKTKNTQSRENWSAKFTAVIDIINTYQAA